MAFELAPELQRDCIELADWSLCKVLLMNDSQYPWFILVPRVAGCREIIDLDEKLQAQFWQESAQLSRTLQAVFSPDKLNIARFTYDAAWPKPVWGLHPAKPYTDEQIAELKKALKL